MNTLINLLPWLALATVSILYYLNRRKITTNQEYKKLSEDQLVLLERINEENRQLHEQKIKVATYIDDLTESGIKKAASIANLEEELAQFQQLVLENEASKSTGSDQDIRGIIESLEDFRFKNSAVVTMGAIELSAEELIREDYIKVIQGLDKIKLFPKHLQEDYQFNPKTLEVKFDLLHYDSGDATKPIAFKSWGNFLIERSEFIINITSYVESVIAQRQINKAVDEALNEKEATNV